MLQSIVFMITFLVAIPQNAGFARNLQRKPNSQPSILQVNSETVRVKLLEAFSGKIISNSVVEVSSYNGIVCRHAPCPNNEKHGIGRSDANGYVVIPTSILQWETYVSTPAHREGTNLISGSKKDINGAWVVKLIPTRTLDSRPYSYRLELIDAESNRPLINTEVRVSFGAGENFDGKTNSLGYIFVPLNKVDLEKDDWIVVSGYRRTKIDWGWANYKMKLERQ